MICLMLVVVRFDFVLIFIALNSFRQSLSLYHSHTGSFAHLLARFLIIFLCGMWFFFFRLNFSVI